MKQKRLKITEKYPHKVILPARAISPTDSIYHKFDIKQQTKAVSTFSDKPRTVRCAEPFIITVKVGKKIKDLQSKI